MLTILRFARTNGITRCSAFYIVRPLILCESSFADACPYQDLFRNFAAALKLPLIHLGLAKDFWREFDDRYLEMEKGSALDLFCDSVQRPTGR